MKTENPYLKVIKERYLSLIVAPVLIISGFFVYARVNGIIVNNFDVMHSAFISNSLVTVTFFVVVIFLFIQTMKLMVNLTNKKIDDAFVIALRLGVIVITLTIGLKYSYFTQKVENFKNERQYYLRYIELYGHRSPQPMCIRFDSSVVNNMVCSILYDQTDTQFDRIASFRKNKEKKLFVPDYIIKLEPHFYYRCFPFHDQNSSTKKNIKG